MVSKLIECLTAYKSKTEYQNIDLMQAGMLAPPPPPILRGGGGLKNFRPKKQGGGNLSKKLGAKLKGGGAYEPQLCDGFCVKRYSFMMIRF